MTNPGLMDDVVYTEPLYLNFTLKDINNEEPFPVRYFPIGDPWYFKIGRGSQSEANMQPQDHNTWFASRVMSRDHAMVRIDPDKRTVEIEDAESMHGTYVRGKRLRPGEPERLFQDDTIIFGADIIRGEATFRALMLKVKFDWSDDPELVPSRSQTPAVRQPDLVYSTVNLEGHRNTFSSDYNDDDDRISEGDVEIISSGPKDRITFTVPDSDDSDSDYEGEETQSSPSSVAEDEEEDEEDDEEDDEEEDEEGNSDVQAKDSSFVTITESKLMPPVVNMAEDLSTQTRSSVVFINEEPQEARKQDNLTRLDKILQDAEDILNNPQDTHAESATGEHDAGRSGFLTAVPESDSSRHVRFEGQTPSLINHSGQTSVGADAPSTMYATITYENEEGHPSNLDGEPNARISEIRSIWTNEHHFDYEVPSALGVTNTLPPVAGSFIPLHSDSVNPAGELINGQYLRTPESIPNSFLQPAEVTPLKHFAKVSISDIINGDTLSNDSKLQKRKADVLCVSENHANNTSLQSVTTEAPLSGSSGERPRKKAKTTTNAPQAVSGRKTFLKYAATAAVGATLGAVSTIFGLAALPADYFA